MPEKMEFVSPLGDFSPEKNEPFKFFYAKFLALLRNLKMSCELFEGVFGKKFKNFTRKIREKEKKH